MAKEERDDPVGLGLSLGSAALLGTLGALAAAPLDLPSPLLCKGLLAAGVITAYQSLPMLRALWHYKALPGPRPLPIVGNILTLIANANIHEVYEQWGKAYGSTYKWFMGSNVVIVMSDIDLVREVGLRKFSNL